MLRVGEGLARVAPEVGVAGHLKILRWVTPSSPPLPSLPP